MNARRTAPLGSPQIPWLRRVALALSGIAITLAMPARASDLGPDTRDCRSALLAGWTHCGLSTATPPLADHRARTEAIESRIDRFLADYGKPPRSAVRALLEPTDDNIRLMLHEQDMTVKNAAYVAERLSALRESENLARSPRVALARPPTAATLGALMQVRATFVGASDAASCRRFANLSEPLLRQVPELDLGVVLTGQPDPVQLHACLAELPLSVPVSRADHDLAPPEFAHIRLERKAGSFRAVMALDDLDPSTLLAIMVRVGLGDPASETEHGALAQVAKP